MSKRKPKPPGYWTLERCLEEARKYDRPVDFSKQSASAYATAQRNGWLDECKAHMNLTRKPLGYWTLERCMDDAAKYKTRSEWQKLSVSGYDAAKRKGWLDQCCDHMDPEAHGKPNGYWTLERCMEDAAKYSSRREWQYSQGSAYVAARKKGWLDQCCAHMERTSYTDNDVVYIWRDADTDLHKIGITSNRVGEQRISMCKRHNDMDPRIVFMLKVPDARAVESKLLELGTDPELDSSIDGYTEFRVLSNDDLREAVNIAYQAALVA